MSQFPEDLIQQFVKMTGLSSRDAERELSKSLQEINSRHGSKEYSSIAKNNKYGVSDYPRFLDSGYIQKYTIRVSLKCQSITVWRKFECPSNISLRHLADLILELMGWENEHLNHIMVGRDICYVPYYQHDPDMSWMEPYFQEEYMLSDILTQKGRTVRMEYDFGDSWMHEIRLSSVEEYAVDEPQNIVFKGGKGTCPPEDCGGVWGYQELQNLNEKRQSGKRLSTEEKDRLDWYGIDKNFDPESFDKDYCKEVCDSFSVRSDVDLSVVDDKESLNAISISTETSPLYDEVLSLAFRIRELEPWEDIDDSDVYAIKMNDGSEVYVATMGNAGQSYGIHVYDGAECFQSYLFSLRAYNLLEFELIDESRWNQYIAVEFEDPEDEFITPAQVRFIDEWAQKHCIQCNAEHGYPLIQHFRPHRYPSMMLNDEHGLTRLKEILEAVVWFAEKILDTDVLTELGFKDYCDYPTEKGGKVVPLLVKSADGYKVERTNLPGRVDYFPTVTLPESELQPLCFLKKKGTQYCRLLHLPGYVGTEEDSENSYVALSLICVDKKTEDMSMSEPAEFSPTYELDTLRNFALKLKSDGSLPQRIIVDESRTDSLLKPFCKSLGIILEPTRTRIPQLTSPCQFMYDMDMTD